MRAPISILASTASLALLGACNLIFSITPGEPAASGGGAPDGGGPDAGGGGGGGSAPCTGTATCEGAVLRCEVEGQALPAATCAAIADCDPIAGKCIDPATRPRLGVGTGRVCAVEDDGTVRCWGANGGGTLVPGDPRSLVPTAAPVTGVDQVRQVAVAAGQACALRQDGSVTCWGANDSGETGVTPNSPPDPAMVEMPGLLPAVEISTSRRCSCARLVDGTVACWGQAATGCFGDVPTAEEVRPTPARVPGVTAAVELHAGSYAKPSCARLASGRVTCWTESLAPTEIPGVTDALSVAVGWQTVIIHSASRGLLWTEQSGSAWLEAAKYLGAPIPSLMTAGDDYCVLRQDGKVACVGLGAGAPAVPAVVPEQPAGVVVEIAAGHGLWEDGAGLTCLRLTGAPLAGRVYCWGDDAGYALGAGAPASFRTPEQVPGVIDAKTISASHQSSSVTSGDGRVTYWGLTASFDSQGSTSPKAVNGLGTDNAVVTSNDVARRVYARKNSGALTLLDTGVAQPGARLLKSGFTDFVTALDRMIWDIGLRADGSIVVFAGTATSNDIGIFGNGTTTATAGQVVTVPSITDASALAAYGDDYNDYPGHACVIRGAAGSVSCWGYNLEGEIGNGAPDGAIVSTPPSVSIPGGEAAVAIAVGRVFSCAVTSSGKVYCWGSNTRGQLGVGEGAPSSNVPVVVTGISTAVGVAAGEAHACAWLADTTVSCWGANDGGQLGDGTFITRFEPVPVAGLTGVAEVAAGPDHTCARHAGGTVSCWGSSYNGQVGTGVTGLFASPLPVQGL